MNVLNNTFSSVIHSKNFRYFWFGQIVSVLGTWIQRTAQTWLVYKMTNSAFLVGLLSAAQFLPILLLTLPAGTVIDRFSKRKIMMVTQFGFLVLGVIMTVLVYANVVQYWEVVALALAYGALQSFDTTARQSFVVELVGHSSYDLLTSCSSTFFSGVNG